MASKNTKLGEMEKVKGWFLGLGVVLVIFGFLMILIPAIGTIAVDLLFGILLLIAGLMQLVFAFGFRKWGGFLFMLLGGLLALIAGLYLLFNPIGGVLALTLLIGAFLLAEGLIKIYRAFKMAGSHREWLFFDGFLALLLGVLVLMAWPNDSAWVLGLFLGIDLLFGGLSFVMLAQAAKTE